MIHIWTGVPPSPGTVTYSGGDIAICARICIVGTGDGLQVGRPKAKLPPGTISGEGAARVFRVK